MGYKPTCELRIHEGTVNAFRTYHPSGWIVDGQTRPRMRVLQQKWVSDVEGEPDQWRDIPLVAGEPHD